MASVVLASGLVGGPSRAALPVVAQSLGVGSVVNAGVPVGAPTVPADASGLATPVAAIPDPQTWPDRRLAAQLILAGVDVNGVRATCRSVRRGLGGLVLFGSPDDGLRGDLRRVRTCSGPVQPWIASDEEGGVVQRLRPLLGRLPSAASMGRMSPAQVRNTARRYGAKMRRIGVTYALSPVADLRYAGSYIAGDGRSFGGSPAHVGRDVKAWIAGMTRARVTTSVKHWPGHGSARDTHTGAGRTISWAELRKRDGRPFRAAFAAGVPTVMVGHLIVPGLTRGLPATQSPAAYRELRRQAGPDTVIVTDALAMAAVTSALGQSEIGATVRALRAGADVALINGTSPKRAVRATVRALRAGRLARARLEASARRVLAAKARFGLVK